MPISLTAWTILGQSWFPWDVTMSEVRAFYATYLVVFGAFIGCIGLLKALAKRAMLLNNTEAALKWYDRLWFLFGPAVRRELKPQIQINLAIVHASQGHIGRALQLLADARRGARLLKTPELLIQACLLHARINIQRQQFDHAQFALQEAKKASERDRRQPGLLRILLAQADLATARGESDETLTIWQQVRRYADARRDLPTSILALTYLGRAAYEASDWPTAEDYLSEAVSRVREYQLTDRSSILACLLFGRLQLQRGHYELARGYLLDAALKAKHREEPALQCSALIETGRLWVEQGRWEKAEDAADQALSIANTLQDPARQAMACQILGELYLQQDQWPGARIFFDRAIVALRHADLPRTSLLVRAGQAILTAHLEEPGPALSQLHDLEREAKSINAGFERIVILDALARVALLQGDGLWSQRYQAAAHTLRQELGVTAALSAQYRLPERFTIAIGG